MKKQTAKHEFLTPGKIVTVSGQYELVGPRGGSQGREVTGVEGKPLPPTPKPGQKYRLADATKHKKP